MPITVRAAVLAGIIMLARLTAWNAKVEDASLAWFLLIVVCVGYLFIEEVILDA